MFYEVILDTGETANKCTIAPLSDRPDFKVMHAKGVKQFEPLKSTVLLHPDGQCLSEIQKTLSRIEGIASVDCVWRRLPSLMDKIPEPWPVLAKIPEGIVTAYPRVSKLDFDPFGGLATIEALFVAAALLGNADLSLLSKYFFAQRFLELNQDRLESLGAPRIDLAQLVVPYKSRSALQRRMDRGRATL